MSDHNHQALQNHILSLSNSDNWSIARAEWIPGIVIYNPLGTHCPCGVAINDMCYLHNIENKKETFIGNVCINNFMEIPVEKSLFDGIRRIKEDLEANTNAALTRYCHEQSIINDWECEFLLNTNLKRKPTEKQLQKQIQINTKILREVVA